MSESVLQTITNYNNDNNYNNNNYSFSSVSSNTKLVIAEYVFIDGFGCVRSKTRVIQGKIISGQEAKGLIFVLDVWNVDGSSTGQSETTKSDIILMPCAFFNDPFNESINGIQYCLVMCNVFNIDGSPHASNSRENLFRILSGIGETKLKEEDPWFGIEQEYVIYDATTRAPYKWSQKANVAGGQGPFYCGVGGNVALGREIAMEHLKKCITAGIAICGINSEVAPAQWEFQIGICNPMTIGDHLWMARYILARVAELHNAYISYDPKPLGDEWNGSGGHTNFSTAKMRATNGLEVIKQAIDKLSKKHKEHLAVYGIGNERRLTGNHETSNMSNFTFGEYNRGSSVRIPVNVLIEGCGYLEDRRPASNADPYLVVAKMLETIL